MPEVLRYIELALCKKMGALNFLSAIAHPKKSDLDLAVPSSVKVVLGETPLYGNIGDLAIAEAEKAYLEHNNVKYYEYTEGSNRIQQMLEIEKNISEDTVVLLQGGGNMGNRYFGLDIKRASAIEVFRKNKIIIMPQTVDYEGSLGEALRIYMNDVYEKHGNVHLFAREKGSYLKMKKYFPNIDVQLAPDIVMTYKIPEDNTARENQCLFVFRNDGEKNVEDELIKKLHQQVKKYYPSLNIVSTDTVMDSSVVLKNRKKIVASKLNEFRNSKLIITDRLHGMIFAAITSTPCVAFDNKNKKISNVYNTWIKNSLPYIRVIESDAHHFISSVKSVLANSNYSYPVQEYFENSKKITDIINA